VVPLGKKRKKCLFQKKRYRNKKNWKERDLWVHRKGGAGLGSARSQKMTRHAEPQRIL